MPFPVPHDIPTPPGIHPPVAPQPRHAEEQQLHHSRLELLQRALEAGHGTVLSRELTTLGISPESVRTLVSRRILVRAGRGSFVDGARYGSAGPDQRHVLRATAIARTWPKDVLVSHTSAALLHGLPLIRSVSDRVHGCRRATGQHRRTATHTIHTGYADALFTLQNGVAVLEPRFVVMGVAELHGRDAGVVAADAALHRGMVSMADLASTLEGREHHPAHGLMERVTELADARTESPGESLTRLVLGGLGYVALPQVVIRDTTGAFLGRVDFLIEGTRVIIEFDGMSKYASVDDLVAEKRRELRLRRAGYTVVRLVWADLDRPGRIRVMIEAALASERRDT